MPPIVVILIVILALVAIICALVFPGKKKNIDEYVNVKYAHRGLHNGERAENSISAMKAAVEAGFGIELDVRLSKDGVLMVFHDDTLDRVCGREGKVINFTAEELATFKLNGTDDGIPTFDEVLEVVGGKVPLLVEIKENAGDSSVSKAAAERLKSYSGPYIVESFNPLSVKNAASILPEVACGFLSRHFTKEEETKKPLYFILENLLINRVSNPSFIAYKHEDHYMPMLKLARLLGARTIAWTVRSPEEEKAAYEHGFATVIFENYIPEEK
jgi:glycerophosphoryl diester phosphodiesterase